MRYTSGLGFDSRWRPNIFNSVLFKKACDRERIHLRTNLLRKAYSYDESKNTTNTFGLM